MYVRKKCCTHPKCTVSGVNCECLVTSCSTCDLNLNIVIQTGVYLLSDKRINIQVYDCVIIFQTSTIVLQSRVKMAVAALTWSMATDARVWRDTSAEIARLVRCISTVINIP